MSSSLFEKYQQADFLDIPSREYNFVGRTDELEFVMNCLRNKEHCQLKGLSGIGKTTLAKEAIHRLKETDELTALYEGGVIYHQCDRHGEILQIANAILDYYGQPIQKQEDMIKQARYLLIEHQPLLFIDGAEKIGERHLEQWFDKDRGGATLLLTSYFETLPIETCAVDTFTPHEAQQLLQTLAPKIQHPDEAQRLCELVGFFPLAINLLGGYIRRVNPFLPQFMQYLEENLFVGLEITKRGTKSVRLLLEQIYGQLSDQARQAWAVASCLALRPFYPTVIDIPLSLDNDSCTFFHTNEILAELSRYNLVKRIDVCYQLTHVLIHEYGKRITLSSDSFFRLVGLYQELGRSFAQEHDVWGVFEEEKNHLFALINNLKAHHHWKQLDSLGRTWIQLIKRRGYFLDSLNILQILVDTPKDMVTSQLLSEYLGEIGVIYNNLGDLKRSISYSKQALILSKQVKDIIGQVGNLINLGVTYNRMSRYKEALSCFQEAENISQHLIDGEQEEAAILGNIGDIFYNIGRHNEAYIYYQKALEIAEKIDDKGQILQLKLNLDVLFIPHTLDGQKEHNFYELFEEILEYGDRGLELNAIMRLGEKQSRRNEHTLAYLIWKQALSIATEINMVKEKATCQVNLGFTCIQLNTYTEASDLFGLAFKIGQSAGYDIVQVHSLVGLGILSLKQGQWFNAIHYFGQTYVWHKKLAGNSSKFRKNIIKDMFYLLQAYQRFQRSCSVNSTF